VEGGGGGLTVSGVSRNLEVLSSVSPFKKGWDSLPYIFKIHINIIQSDFLNKNPINSICSVIHGIINIPSIGFSFKKIGLYYHTRLDVSSGPFQFSDCKTVCTSHVSHRATCSAHHILIFLTTVIIISEKYKL
jgi:hypothetical protein